MFGWLRDLCGQWREVYRVHKHASPAAIGKHAAELAHLAELAEYSTLPMSDVAPLRHLQQEMLQLAQMTTRPEFAKLPLERRQLLSRNIEHSRQILISTMQMGLSTSDRIQ